VRLIIVDVTHKACCLIHAEAIDALGSLTSDPHAVEGCYKGSSRPS
jgi:hypothetical protein